MARHGNGGGGARSRSKAAKGQPDFRPVVRRVCSEIESKLTERIPELSEAVQVGEGEASFTVTLQIKRRKGGRFAAKLTSRVRAPDEPVEIDMHVDTTTGQLALGFDPKKHGEETPEPEEASE